MGTGGSFDGSERSACPSWVPACSSDFPLTALVSILSADYVYFENSSSNPYLVRRIEELNKVSGHGTIPRDTPHPISCTHPLGPQNHSQYLYAHPHQLCT